MEKGRTVRVCKLERDIESLQKSWISPRLEPENALAFRVELQRAIYCYNNKDHINSKKHVANANKLLRQDEGIPEG